MRRGLYSREESLVYAQRSLTLEESLVYAQRPLFLLKEPELCAEASIPPYMPPWCIFQGINLLLAFLVCISGCITLLGSLLV